MKTFADFKRDSAKGNMSLELIDWYGKMGEKIPKRFTENRIIEFVADNRSEDRGYLICGHCGIVAYMVLAAMYILNKKNYTVSQHLIG